MDQEDDIQADWSASELSVLRSAELDVPARGSVERALTAIGVGAALGAGVGGTTSLGASTQLGSAAHGSLWLKWSGAALVGAGIAGVIFFARQHGQHEQRAPQATASGVTLASSAVVTTSEPKLEGAPSAGPVVAAAAEGGSSAPSANTTASTSARAAAPDGKDALAAEIRLIDEARERLRQGDASGSLQALTRYDQLVKHGGSMRAEATVVRIEAYQTSGDSARAAALGQRFLSKNPDSPYAGYVKRVLARAN